MKRAVFLLVLVLIFPALAASEGGVKKRRPLPYEYGRVVINNNSEISGLSPVVFDHWVHRSMFTCRLCHVDIGFAMKAGETGIKAADNMKGYYCGTCHNGKMLHDGKPVFESCQPKFGMGNPDTCNRCHSQGKTVKRDFDFNKLTAELPKERFGNGVDWEKAEEQGLVKPIDYIEGISIKRKAIALEKDVAFVTKEVEMPEIIFSHKKHAVWTGCELCHPEIFVGVKKGATKYSMVEIFDGKYCGACHVTVAFPLIDCGRCHTRPVQ